MAVAFGQPAWITDVWTLLEQRLSAGTKLPADKVFAYAGDGLDLLANPPADKFITVSVEALPVDQRRVAGGGAAHTAIDAVFGVNVYCKLGTDRELQSPKLMRDASQGFGLLVYRACQAVQLPDPPTAGSSTLREPMRFLGVTFNPRKPATGWAWATIRVECLFRADLTVTR